MWSERHASCCGWPWLECKLFGAGAVCPGGCSYSTHCPWQLRDFCLAPVPPTLSYLILLVTYTSPCAAAHSASHLSVGFCYKLNCWKVQQSGLKTSGKGERWVEAAAAALLSVEVSPSALCCLSPASCFEITQPSKWELKQFKLCRCVLTSAAALVFLLKLHFNFTLWMASGSKVLYLGAALLCDS